MNIWRKKQLTQVLQHSFHEVLNLFYDVHSFPCKIMFPCNEFVYFWKSVQFLHLLKFKRKPACLKHRYTPPRRANIFLMPVSLIHQSTWRTCFLVSPSLDKWSSTELMLLIAAPSLSARSLPANSCISLIWNVHLYMNWRMCPHYGLPLHGILKWRGVKLYLHTPIYIHSLLLR